MSENKPKTMQDIQDEYNKIVADSAGVDLNQQMMKSLIQHATGSASKTKYVPRLAFEENPKTYDNYAGLYKLKRDLIPHNILKQIRVKNFLVACILRARSNTMSMMGHIRKDRFDVGLEVDVKPELKDHIEPEQMVKVNERINIFKQILINCGHTDGLDEDEKMNLSDFLHIQTSNGLTMGWHATEIIRNQETGKFHRFRPVDSGTIHPTVRKGEAAESIRVAAAQTLQYLTGHKIDTQKFQQDEYAWVQAIEGSPYQAFTSEELLVHNLYPSSDVEHNGYPVTPLDTVITSVNTHLSIEKYNYLYFINGRAARGVAVIRSDEADQATIEAIKQDFNANVNNVSNSFRTPILGLAKDDNFEWVSTQPQKKDGEFQFLFDQTIRNILGAFNISPDELPGFNHLSRGTNQAALSESNNEFKLLASRDNGIRPLILKFQSFLNDKLFPLIDPELSQLCNIVIAGFDAETKEQESQRLERDSNLHYSYDEIMDEVDKEQVGPAMGGNVPFNERYRQVLDTYTTAGQAMAFFMDDPAAVVDPILRYKRDEFFLKNLDLMSQYNPEAVRAYFTTREDVMDILKMYLEDYLIEDDLG